MIISIKELTKLYRFICFFCLLAFILGQPNYTKNSGSKLDKIKLKGKWFVDSNDRKVLFHGINAVKKEFPWVPNTGSTDMTNMTQLINLKNWGFNVVRLGGNIFYI